MNLINLTSRVPTDHTLEEWKRERILIKAMMSGEVLPSPSWNPAGFKERLTELDEDIRAIEGYQQAEQEQQADEHEVEILNQEQEQVSFFLRLLFKFSADESIRQDIEKKTRELHEQWTEKQNPKSYKQLADGIRQTLKVYEDMCNTYAKMPTSAPTIQQRLTELKQGQDAMSVDIKGLAEDNKTITGMLRKLGAEKRAMTITQKQVANDFGVKIGTVKRWDKGQGCRWGYDVTMRTDPTKQNQYLECVGAKRLYEKFRKKAKQDGRVWRYTPSTFIDNLHSCNSPSRETEKVYEAMMNCMDRLK